MFITPPSTSLATTTFRFFVPDATDYENTWLGSIGVTALGYDQNTTLQFTAADWLVRIGDRVELDAKTIKKLTFNKGELSVLHVPSNHTQTYPRVLVDFIDSKLSFPDQEQPS